MSSGPQLDAPAEPTPRSRGSIITFLIVLLVVLGASYFVPRFGIPVDDLDSPATCYGPWVLAPAVITIILAILLRQVIPALSVGVLVASMMLVPFAPGETDFGHGPVAGVALAVEHYLIGAAADADHVKIIIFTMAIGGMVGVIAANGGTGAVVNAVARWGTTRRRGQVATWFAGLLVFFDDYANAMIVGPSMRPVADRLRISRAKLAYIVDSTAAPVASIALIGTWIGAEVGYIQDGLDQLQDLPGFLAGITGYQAFLASIPYRFYAILALVMVLSVGLLGRDFGPMRKAEQEATEAVRTDITDKVDEGTGRAWYAVVPVLVLIVLTLSLLILPGWSGQDWTEFETSPGTWRGAAILQEIVANADPYRPILYGAFGALLVAGLISITTRSLTLGQTVDAATASMSRMVPTLSVLVLAWTLSATMRDLQLGEVAVTLLQSAGFDDPFRLRALPLCIFLSACVVSFATGTSWGTMGILCPATVTIAAGLLHELPLDEAQPLFYAAVGAVLAGAIFGDHCSPISDTTVLSSLASSCSLEQHVWTQMPYALVVAGVSIVCGDILCRYTGTPAWAGLIIGAGVLVAILLIVGRPGGRQLHKTD